DLGSDGNTGLLRRVEQILLRSGEFERIAVILDQRVEGSHCLRFSLKRGGSFPDLFRLPLPVVSTPLASAPARLARGRRSSKVRNRNRLDGTGAPSAATARRAPHLPVRAPSDRNNALSRLDSEAFDGRRHAGSFRAQGG